MEEMYIQVQLLSVPPALAFLNDTALILKFEDFLCFHPTNY